MNRAVQIMGYTVLKGKDVTGCAEGEKNGWVVCISEDG